MMMMMGKISPCTHLYEFLFLVFTFPSLCTTLCSLTFSSCLFPSVRSTRLSACLCFLVRGWVFRPAAPVGLSFALFSLFHSSFVHMLDFSFLFFAGWGGMAKRPSLVPFTTRTRFIADDTTRLFMISLVFLDRFRFPSPFFFGPFVAAVLPSSRHARTHATHDAPLSLLFSPFLL